MVATVFKPNDVEEEITGEETEIDTVLPDWYVTIEEYIRPVAAVFGVLVSYTGMKSVVTLNLHLVKRYFYGLVCLAIVQILINIEVRGDYSGNDAAATAVINTAISVIFWSFCLRTVHRLLVLVRRREQPRTAAPVDGDADDEGRSNSRRSDGIRVYPIVT